MDGLRKLSECICVKIWCVYHGRVGIQGKPAVQQSLPEDWCSMNCGASWGKSASVDLKLSLLRRSFPFQGEQGCEFSFCVDMPQARKQCFMLGLYNDIKSAWRERVNVLLPI